MIRREAKEWVPSDDPSTVESGKDLNTLAEALEISRCGAPMMPQPKHAIALLEAEGESWEDGIYATAERFTGAEAALDAVKGIITESGKDQFTREQMLSLVETCREWLLGGE